MSFDLYCVGFADNLTELLAVHIRIGWELHDPDRPDRRGGGDCSYEGGCIIVLRIEREGLLLKDLPFDSTTPPWNNNKRAKRLFDRLLGTLLDLRFPAETTNPPTPLSGQYDMTSMFINIPPLDNMGGLRLQKSTECEKEAKLSRWVVTSPFLDTLDTLRSSTKNKTSSRHRRDDMLFSHVQTERPKRSKESPEPPVSCSNR